MQVVRDIALPLVIEIKFSASIAFNTEHVRSSAKGGDIDQVEDRTFPVDIVPCIFQMFERMRRQLTRRASYQRSIA